MKKQYLSENKKNLNILCVKVRELIAIQEYQKCEDLILHAMENYPHEPEPHNLLGILLEKKGEHLLAMKHFRASLALDPTYLPVQQNLKCYGTFFSSGYCAYDESDCPAEEEQNNNYKVEYDMHGIGHVIRRN
jgi:tetratricopeptide (TPR) repeat protein